MSTSFQGTPAPNQWFGRPTLSTSAGNMVLRDAAGPVVDSLNYGGLVDPWAAEGYQATSGAGESGRRVPTPGGGRGGFGGPGAPAASANNIKVAGVADLGAGQTIMIDTGASLETAVIATVGTAGATMLGAATNVGATVIPVASGAGFTVGQTITVAAPLTFAHAAGAQVSGSGITLTAALIQAHASGA